MIAHLFLTKNRAFEYFNMQINIVKIYSSSVVFVCLSIGLSFGRLFCHAVSVLKFEACKCTKIAGKMNAKNDRGVKYGGNIFSEGIGKGISQ